jgi:undecaprenyl phosphate N,N'-diacetylbacillosamine 1-phosphate transferase
MYRTWMKRLFDLSMALAVLLVASPIMLLITIGLAFANRGKPFFLQERPGWKERPFVVIKFKTMNDDTDAAGNLLPDNRRLTGLGRFIRKTSLDELPQLINVIKGEMSLVGPRPLLFKYIPLYSAEQRRRHDVRPGITGWAQVNGRNRIDWKQKFEYDIYYIEHLSFALDVKILWLTITKVIRREGINQSEEQPMRPFNGNN